MAKAFQFDKVHEMNENLETSEWWMIFARRNRDQRSKQRWPKGLHRWLASLRQIIETVNDKLLNTFHLARERPHDVAGFRARLAAKVALHNFCIWVPQGVPHVQ